MFDFGPPISGDTRMLEQTLYVGLIPSIIAIIALIVNIFFAIGIYQDASARRMRRRRLLFAPPIIWAGAALIGSVLGVALYWLIHASTLAPPEPPSEPSPEPPSEPSPDQPAPPPPPEQ